MNTDYTNPKYRDYDAFFRETVDLFEDITRYAILLENIGGGKVEVTSINELRGVLFHLYKFISNINIENKPDYFVQNYYDAKDHLHRAYFDIFTMLHSYLAQNIYDYSQKYDSEIINAYYPKYYTHVTPEMSTISEHMAKVRSDREQNLRASNDDVLTSKGILTVLLDWHRELQSLTSTFINAQTKMNEQKAGEKLRNRWDTILKIAVPVLVALLTFFLTRFLGKN